MEPKTVIKFGLKAKNYRLDEIFDKSELDEINNEDIKITIEQVKKPPIMDKGSVVQSQAQPTPEQKMASEWIPKKK